MMSLSTILVFIFTVLILPCWTTVLLLKPKDLFLTDCRLCNRVNSHSVSIGNEALHHLKLLPEEGYILLLGFRYLHNRGLKKLACYSKKNYRGSRMRRALFSLWLIFPILFTLFLGLVWGVICLFFLLVSVIILAFKLSPVMTLPCCIFMKILTKISSVRDRISRMSFILFRFLVILLSIYLLFCSNISVSWSIGIMYLFCRNIRIHNNGISSKRRNCNSLCILPCGCHNKRLFLLC